MHCEETTVSATYGGYRWGIKEYDENDSCGTAVYNFYFFFFLFGSNLQSILIENYK